MELAAKRRVPSGDFRLLRRQVGVVQFFDFLRNGECRFASRNHFAAQETSRFGDLLRRRPVEERIKGLPVVVEFVLEALNLIVAIDESLEFRERRHVLLPELSDLFAVFRGALARDVQEVVADEDA